MNFFYVHSAIEKGIGKIISVVKIDGVKKGSIFNSCGTIPIEDFTFFKSFDDLFTYLKSKDFKKMRQWVVNNIDTDASSIFRGIYDRMIDKVKPQSVPQLVLILADYQYKNAFVADMELNVVACMTEIMANVEFV